MLPKSSMAEMEEENVIKLSGFLMLVVAITALASGVLAGMYGVELNAHDVETTLANVDKYPTQHIVGLIVEVVSFIATVALAGTLYLGFKSFNKVQAMIGSLWLSASGIVLAVHDMGNFGLPWIARDYAVTTGAHKLAIAAVARSMLLTGKWGVTIGSTFLVLGIFTYCVILISKLSKSVGWFGIVASVLALIAAWIGWFNPSLQYVGFALFVPMLLWELIFGIWLVRK